MEIWDGYLKDGTLANCDLVRGEPIPQGLYHLVSEILVRHIDGDYLLMKRDTRKPNYGGYYEATAGGSALKGEDKVSCAKRELLEETGIYSNDFTEIGQYTSHDTIFYSFLCVTDCDKTSILLQEGETISYKWVSENDFISFVNSNEMIDTQRERYHKYLVQMGYVVSVVLLSRQSEVHNMRLYPSPFEKIKNGQKTIELRLYDEKRQKVKVGDKIIFTENTTGETLNTIVMKLHRFNTFSELYKSLPLLKCGYTVENVDKANPADMEQYYSVEEQRKYGVVGIELSRPKPITDESVICLRKQEVE